jgi:hypothetical protein
MEEKIWGERTLSLLEMGRWQFTIRHKAHTQKVDFNEKRMRKEKGMKVKSTNSIDKLANLVRYGRLYRGEHENAFGQERKPFGRETTEG